MDHIERLTEGLGRAEAYPHDVAEVRAIQTHISVVFLAGPYAYKVKKPVEFAFLDFSTLDRRRRFCHEEVRLNRRLAPSVYHGVVPIVAAPGGPRVLDVLVGDAGDEPPQGSGEVLEWAVRMERLPEERTLKSLLRRGELDGPGAVALLERLARLLAEFHATAARGPEISRLGDFPTIAANARENFDEMEALSADTVSPAVLRRLRALSESMLSELRPLMERRAREDIPCDGHGDLRLGHVYHLPDGSADGDIVIVDCIEFNERFRYADPMADLAFLVMELEYEDRPGLARAITDRHLEAMSDREGAELIPYYVAYRDIVRGKVRTLEAQDTAIAERERDRARARATRHFLRALGRLAPPDERPALILLAGLPGVGKSVLARGLADDAGFTWIDTDRVRKGLAAGHGPVNDRAGFEAGVYTREWTERTYAGCLQRAGSMLREGARVVVEGSFRSGRHRHTFLERARQLGVPALLILCEADREVVRDRLMARAGQAGEEGASDADWGVYQAMERRWEPPGAESDGVVRRIRTDRSEAEVLDRAMEILRVEGLLRDGGAGPVPGP